MQTMRFFICAERHLFITCERHVYSFVPKGTRSIYAQLRSRDLPLRISVGRCDVMNPEHRKPAAILIYTETQRCTLLCTFLSLLWWYSMETPWWNLHDTITIKKSSFATMTGFDSWIFLTSECHLITPNLIEWVLFVQPYISLIFTICCMTLSTCRN